MPPVSINSSNSADDEPVPPELTTDPSSEYLTTNQSAYNASLEWSFFLHEPIYRNIFILCCVFIASLCICGNLLVLYVLHKNQRMRTLTNLFLSNLAVADFFVGIFCVIPFMSHYLYAYWYLGRILCKMWKFIETASLTVSMLSLQVIALERYIAINHPLKARRLFTQNKMYIAVLLVWLFAAAYSAPLLMVFDIYSFHGQDDGVVSYCHFTDQQFVLDAYKLMNFFLWYSLPLLIMVVLYMKIGLTVKRSQVNHQTIYRVPRSTGQRKLERSEVCRKSSDIGANKGNSEALLALTSDVRQTQDSESNQTIVSKMKLWWRKRKLELPSKAKSAAVSGKTGPYGDSAKYTHGRQSPSGSKTPRSSKLPQTFSFKSESKKNPNVFGCVDIDRRRSHCAPQLSGTSTNSMSSDSLEEPCVYWTRVPAKRSTVTIIKRQGDASDPRSSDESHTDTGGRPNSLNIPSSSAPPNSPGTGLVRRCRLTTQSNPRRRVSRLLIAIVLAFALLVLPFHIRNLMELAHVHYRSEEDAILVAIITILSLYTNSAVNPILYSFISQSFRRSLRESVCCSHPEKKIRPARVQANTPEMSSAPNTRHSSC